MRADDPTIRWIDEPQLGSGGRMYLPLFVQGLTTTFKHLTKSLGGGAVTVSYPEQEPEIGNRLIYRGVHRLNKDKEGRVKCVACFLCATACPAHCIDIIGVESPWPDREKYPQSFTIDELRCIYCGMCEEACPVDAIELTSLYNLTGRSREEMIFDKEKLLSVFDATKDAEPMKSDALGGHVMTLLAAADNADLLTKAVTCPTAWGLAVGSLALWLLVPGGRWTASWFRIVGGVLALVSGILFAVDLPLFGPLGVQVVFWLLCIVTLGSGVAMISSKSPVYSALWFALSLVGSAGLLLMQGAQFLGGATIVVYAGAIVVTFLFVIMLSQPEGHAVYDRISWGWFPRPAAILAAAVFLGLLAAGMSGMKQEAGFLPTEALQTTELARDGGVLHPQHMVNLGRRLFSQQLVAVEVAGTLLMAALVGAIAIAIHGKQWRISEGVGHE